MRSIETSNTKLQGPDKLENTKSQTYFDLEERMGIFGEAVISFCRTLKRDDITRALISQIVRSATSIGANYCEANNASSRKDFRNKAYIAKKEAQETKHWLRMLKAAAPDKTDEVRKLWQEAHELVLILQTILQEIDRKTEN